MHHRKHAVIQNCFNNMNLHNQAVNAKKKQVYGIIISVLPTIPVLWNMFIYVMAFSRSMKFANFYGIDYRFLIDTDKAKEMMVIVIFGIVLLVGAILISKLKNYFPQKSSLFLVFISWYLNFFIELSGISMLCIEYKLFIPDNAQILIIIVLFFFSLILAVFLGLDEKIIPERFKKALTTINPIAFLISLVVFCITISVLCGLSISRLIGEPDKQRDYEITDTRKAVVSEYKGNLVLMECEIEDHTLILKKGRCILQEIPGTRFIKYRFDRVICE